MKTKNSFQARLILFTSLVLILGPALSLNAAAVIPPETDYRLSELIITGYGVTRQLYTYDECDRLTSLLKQSKSGNVWINKELSTYTYDAFGNVLTKTVQSLPNPKSADGTYTYTRDCNGNVLTQYYDRATSNRATNTTYEYDCDGNLLSKTTESTYDGVVWTKNNRITNTYDENGNLLVETTFGWYNENWFAVEMIIQTYDENGNMITMLYQYWDSESSTWIGYASYTLTYDEYGHRLSYVYQAWYGDGWYNETMESYTYDSEGRCISEITAMWMGNGWQDYWKTIYEYTSGLTLAHGYTWDWDLNDWAPNGPVNLYLYNNGEMIQIYVGYAALLEAYLYTTPKLSLEVSPAQTIYYGYPPLACATLSVTAIGGTPPYSYSWDNGETTQSFEVCPTETTDYMVTVTDVNGCQAQACTKVEVIDVHCGNNGDKVELCHCPPGNPMNCQTLCVGMASVPAHLAHGDLLGACGIDRSCVIFKAAPALAEVAAVEIGDDMFIKANPNPVNQSAMVTYLVNQPEKVTITLVNAMGQPVMTLFEGYAPQGVTQEMEADLGNLQPGIYLLILQQEDGTRITEKILKQR